MDSFTFKTRKTIFYPFSCISWSIQIIKAHDNFWRFLLEFMFVFILIVCIQQRHDNMAWNRSSFTLNYTLYLLFTHSYILLSSLRQCTWLRINRSVQTLIWRFELGRNSIIVFAISLTYLMKKYFGWSQWCHIK
jgi:hypothetical protein